MGAIFISHSREDNAFAGVLAERLQAWGHRSLFLDFHGKHGITGGQTWERELYRRLQMCRAMLVVCSEASMGSKWCFAEVAYARAQGKPVIPLQVEACAIDDILRDRQVLDFRERTNDAWERLQNALRREGLDPNDTFDWDPVRPPYPGLLAFQEADAAVYRGRDADVHACLEGINRLSRLGGASVLLLLGDSGTGKSSLLRAGLLPRLRRDPDRWLVLDTFRPTAEPVAEFGNVIASALRVRHASGDGAAIRATLRRAIEADGEHVLARCLGEYGRDLRLASGTAEARVLVFVDQVEELFTRTYPGECHAFAALLRAACTSGMFLVIGSLRSDFLGALQRDPSLSDLPVETLTLAPLASSALRSVVTEPASVAGLELEPALVDALIEDAADVYALPLLAFGLRELWERRTPEGQLGLTAYRNDLGGLEGAVARSAERTLRSVCRSAEQEAAVRRAFLGMARVDERGAFVGRPLPWRHIAHSARVLLEPFVEARLLVSRGDGGEGYVEVAHEALFAAWDRLNSWLEEEREALRVLGRVRREATAWEEAGCGNDLLLPPGRRLEEATALRESGLELSASEEAFVRASETSARRRRTIRLATVALVGVLAVVAAILAFMADTERREAESRRDEVLRLSDVKLLRDLIDEWQGFDLLDPRTGERIQTWLTEARELESNLPRHRAALAALDLQDARSAWQGEVLHELLQGIEDLTAPEDGLFTEVLALQDRQRRLIAQSIEANERAWDDAADLAAHDPRYRDLDLQPQVGLVPLGADPETGLLEFAHVGSGVVPRRLPTGRLDRTGDMAIVFVLLPGATLDVGAQRTDAEGAHYDPDAEEAEGPVHEVTLAPMLLSKYECTRAQWRRLRGEDDGPGSEPSTDDLLPVTNITWDDANNACERHALRLPAEAEWEHACRATFPGYVAWSTGNDVSAVVRVANLGDALAPVGTLEPNGFGLHDLHGNAWEWCGTIMQPYDASADDPPADEGERVCRGGGYDFAARYGRCSARSSNLRVHSSPTLGFRAARSLIR